GTSHSTRVRILAPGRAARPFAAHVPAGQEYNAGPGGWQWGSGKTARPAQPPPSDPLTLVAGRLECLFPIFPSRPSPLLGGRFRTERRGTTPSEKLKPLSKLAATSARSATS